MLDQVLTQTTLLDIIRLFTIVLGTGLIGSIIGYAKSYKRVQEKTRMGLSGTRPVFALLGSYVVLVIFRLVHHVDQFHNPADWNLLVNPIVFFIGSWGAVRSIKHMQEVETNA